MDRKVLQKMTARELIELVERQDRAIISLDQQRCDANAVIEHLAVVTECMKNLRHDDVKREHDQEHLDNYISEMYMKYPVYLASAVKEGEKE